MTDMNDDEEKFYRSWSYATLLVLFVVPTMLGIVLSTDSLTERLLLFTHPYLADSVTTFIVGMLALIGVLLSYRAFDWLAQKITGHRPRQ